jgi:hypothetical protein
MKSAAALPLGEPDEATMTEGQEIAERINEQLTSIKRGTLRFWGNWFGRPYDNWHQVVSCGFTGEVLKLTFNEGETLHVSNGHKATVSSRTFQIATASRVRWEWYAYGRPKTKANLYFLDFTRTVDGISPETNVDWYTPTFEFDLSLPAVEIL